MLFYSIFLLEESVALHTLDQECIAIAQRGHLISTQKNYKAAKEIGLSMAREKQLLFIDFTVLKL